MNESSQRGTTRRSNRWVAHALLLLALMAGRGWAQGVPSPMEPPIPIDGGPPPDDGTPPPPANTARFNVHGVVRNSLTGEGVGHALVQIEGDAHSGALTAGDGSFELTAVPAGAQTFTVTKPGFQDRPFGGEAVELLQGGGRESIHASGNHSVVVAEGMPELSFVLGPAAAIEGMVQLANGEPAPGVVVQLARRSIESGHRVWQLQSQARTHAGGNFRFGSLVPGEYAVFTSPFLDADAPRFDDNATEEDTDASNPAREAAGYAAVYYPDARDPGGLTPITLNAGQTQQIAFTLTQETFHRVSVGIADQPASLGAATVHGSLMDAAGRSLEYRSSYNPRSNSMVAMLPDGNYQMLIATAPSFDLNGPRRQTHRNPSLGVVEFTVAGKPLTVPRVALVEQQPPPIEVNTLGGSTSEERTHEMVVLASQAAGWVDDGMVSAYASGPLNGPLAATYTVPGVYWLHPQLSEKDLCEDSLSAAGAPMAREPVRVAVGGSTPPLTLTLRHDCAQLTLSLPAAVMGFGSGEEPYYTVYVVPDFDFTHDLNELTLRPTSGGSLTVESLTPGRYRVYTFAGPHPLAFHDRAALARLRAQEVTLLPGAKAELTLEVGGK